MENNKQIGFIGNILTVMLLLFVFMVAPLFVEAQFIQIKIDIPPSSGVEGIGPPQFLSRPNLKTGEENTWGMIAFSVYASENIQPLVRLYTSGSTKAGQHFDLKLAWKNNGETSPPADINFVGTPVSFPLSNSGKLIDNIKGRPEMLNAKLFVAVQTSEQQVNTVYAENIEIQIEYN